MQPNLFYPYFREQNLCYSKKKCIIFYLIFFLFQIFLLHNVNIHRMAAICISDYFPSLRMGKADRVPGISKEMSISNISFQARFIALIEVPSRVACKFHFDAWFPFQKFGNWLLLNNFSYRLYTNNVVVKYFK